VVSAAPVTSVISTVLIWFVFWELVGVAGLPLARTLLPRHADAGAGCGRVLFILFFTVVVFLTSSLGLNDRSRGALAAIAAGLVTLSGVIAYRGRTELIKDVRSRAADIVLSEALFVASFLLFLAPLLYTDTSRFGERAMDLAFLTKLSFGGSLPPENPYMSGVPLSYYYYGHLIYASISSLLGLAPTESYVLATATVGALTVAATASLLSRLVGPRGGRLLGVFCTCFSMNLAYVRDWISVRSGDPFLMSNWLVGDAIDESLIYTFIIAELHAHALVMPACITAVALALAMSDRSTQKVTSPRSAATLLALACVLGSLGPTNLWSVVSFALVCIVIFAGAAYQRGEWNSAGAVRALALWSTVVVLAAVMYTPYYIGLASPAASLQLVRAQTSEPFGFVLHWGLFFWIVLGWALIRPGQRNPTRRAASALWATAAAAAALLAVEVSLVDRLVQLLPLCLALAACISSLFFASELRTEGNSFFSWLLAAIGFLLIAGCEVVYVNHSLSGDAGRANTVFRVYMDAWLLLGVGTAYPVAVLFREAVAGRARYFSAAWAMPTVLLSLVGLRYTVVGILNKTDHFRSGPHLSAIHFMEAKDAGYADAIRWLQDRRYDRSSAPVVVEAVDANREADWLGIPTPARAYVAWVDKLREWNYSVHQIRPRLDTVRRLYELRDAAVTCALMQVEGIDLIFFGMRESAHFGAAAREKFLRAPFRQVFASGESGLFACNVGQP
jgi:YYY domain-containing protein